MPSNFLQLRRRLTDYLATFVAASLSTLVVGTLVAIFAYLVIKGGGSVNWAFLTHTPKPVGEIGGGMANAIAINRIKAVPEEPEPDAPVPPDAGLKLNLMFDARDRLKGKDVLL